MKRETVKADEITFELLIQAVFELMRLEKYKGRNELEMFRVAYDYLDFGKKEFETCEREKILRTARNNRKELSRWAEAEKQITGSNRRGERLRKFFEENPHYRQSLVYAEDRFKSVSQEDVRSLESLKRSSLSTAYIPQVKASFEKWDSEKKSEQAKNAVRKGSK